MFRILCHCPSLDLHPVIVPHCPRPRRPSLDWATATAPQMTAINPLWKPPVHQAKYNRHNLPIFTAFCCSETCYAALISIQIYHISKFPTLPLLDASNEHFLLCTPPSKATQTFYLLEGTPLSPLPIKSGMGTNNTFDIFNIGCCSPYSSKQN